MPPSSRDCTGQKRKVVSLSYNSIEEQPPLVECPLACLLAWRCRTVVNKYWSISMTFLLVGGWVLFIKMTDKTPLIFVELLNMTKEVLDIKYLRLNIFSTNLSTKERDCWKEKTWPLMPVFLFCPVILLKRTICWEFVEKISLWLSYQYILFSTIHQKYIHHLIHSKTWIFKKQSKSRLQIIC